MVWRIFTKKNSFYLFYSADFANIFFIVSGSVFVIYIFVIFLLVSVSAGQSNSRAVNGWGGSGLYKGQTFENSALHLKLSVRLEAA